MRARKQRGPRGTRRRGEKSGELRDRVSETGTRVSTLAGELTFRPRRLVIEMSNQSAAMLVNEVPRVASYRGGGETAIPREIQFSP